MVGCKIFQVRSHFWPVIYSFVMHIRKTHNNFVSFNRKFLTKILQKRSIIHLWTKETKASYITCLNHTYHLLSLASWETSYRSNKVFLSGYVMDILLYGNLWPYLNMFVYTKLKYGCAKRWVVAMMVLFNNSITVFTTLYKTNIVLRLALL